MSFDPFADDPTPDESGAFDVTPFPTTNDTSFDTDKKENKTVAVQNTEGKLTVTLKGGAGFDAPWIVIHADDAADALEQLKAPELKELMELTKKAGAHFSGGSGSSARPAPQSAAPAQSNAGSSAPSCSHGAMTYRKGISKKTNKPWEAYFCPAPQGEEQCKAKFI